FIQSLLFVLFIGGVFVGSAWDANHADHSLIAAEYPRREPWTTSKIHGSPEPPPPYRAEIAFPKLRFKNPVVMSNAPGSNRLFVGEQLGKIFSFEARRNVERADLLIDLGAMGA